MAKSEAAPANSAIGARDLKTAQNGICCLRTSSSTLSSTLSKDLPDEVLDKVLDKVRCPKGHLSQRSPGQDLGAYPWHLANTVCCFFQRQPMHRSGKRLACLLRRHPPPDSTSEPLVATGLAAARCAAIPSQRSLGREVGCLQSNNCFGRDALVWCWRSATALAVTP